MTNKLIIQQFEYECPKHGNVGDNNIQFQLTQGEISYKNNGIYCLFCYADNVAKFCEKVTMITQTSPTPITS